LLLIRATNRRRRANVNQNPEQPAVETVRKFRACNNVPLQRIADDYEMDVES
jgi:hypothetical protein